MSNDKIEEAEKVIKRIARINGVKEPDTSKLKSIAEKSGAQDNRKYTYWDIIKNWDFLKKTLLLAVAWYVTSLISTRLKHKVTIL